ncbi:MAG: FAD-dependent oxidoreductase [Chloroflexota bacterium]
MPSEMTADVIIVGGGIIGIAIANALAQRRYGRILVLERTYLGAGQTGASVASIEPLTVFPSMAALQRRSISVFKDFSQTIGGDCGFVQLPLAMFVPEAEVPALRDALKAGQAAGSPVEELTPQAFLEKEPGTNLDQIASVYYSTDAGFADPVLTLNAFADAARRNGVTIQQNTPVLSVKVEHDRVVGVETSEGIFSAPEVVLACGLWVDPLLSPLGLLSHLSFVRHYVVSLEMPPDAPHHSVLDASFNFYFRPEKSGGLCLIGTDLRHQEDHFEDLHNPALEPPRVTQALALAVWERVVRRFPAMEAARLRKGYTAIADMSPDSQPLLGKLPLEGLFLAAGLSGIGFKIAPAVGESMAGLIAGSVAAEALLKPLRPMRVQEQQLLSRKNAWSVIA